MARIKDTASLAKKYVTRASGASAEYSESVKQSGQDWQTGAAAAADNYAAATQEAISQGRFARGIAAAGGAFYAERAGTLGAQRYGPGVQASGNLWAEGSAPFLAAGREALTSPRRPRGQNQDRANEMAMRFRQIKLSR